MNVLRFDRSHGDAPRSRVHVAPAAHASPSTRSPLRWIAVAVLLATACVAAQFGRAQVLVDPQSIVVNPAPSFGVEVALDRDPSGDGVPVYGLGDPVEITVRVERTSYVYLFDVRPDGHVVQILPNRLSGGVRNLVRAGRATTFPPSGAPYRFDIDGPAGVSKVVAVASEQPLDTDQLARFRADASFATSELGEAGFADAFSIVVRPVPQASWVTDTARYAVETPTTSPRPTERGTLLVTSSPSGARVLIDGHAYGTTPLEVRLDIGVRDVELVLDGFRLFHTVVDVRGGTHRSLDAELTAQPASPRPRPVLGERVWDQPMLRLPRDAELLELDTKPRRTDVRFRSAMEIESLYDLLHRQVRESGWQRSDLRIRRGEIRVEYRAGRNTRLELRLEQNHGRYELRIQMHGNGRYDDD